MAVGRVYLRLNVVGSFLSFQWVIHGLNTYAELRAVKVRETATYRQETFHTPILPGMQ